MPKRIVIVGGVAAGASAAAKARRTSEEVEIILFEAGPYISFANCGLPYYVGGEIANRDDLLVVTDRMFAGRFNVDVRLNTTVTAVDPKKKLVRFSADGTEQELSYDRLVLATGTQALRPPIAGLDRSNVFTVRTVPDVDAITAKLDAGAKRALVIGGGYIGLESAEQLRRRGLEVTLVELADQLMLAMDREMAYPILESLRGLGVEVVLSDAVERIEDGPAGSAVAHTKSGRALPFDLAVLAVGVRPNVSLAKQAGLGIGKTGAIRVDRYQRTSDPSIYAAGDNSETQHLVLRAPVNIPLAGPANKAGRAAGANAALDLIGASDDDPRRLHLRGVLGTAIVRVGRTVASVTGLTERQARDAGIKHEVTYFFGASNAGYYPDAEGMLLKILYAPATGKLLGAQATGGKGVDKRVDVLATAIAGEMTIEDIEQLDLCYAPPFGSARDVAILGGMVGANARREVSPAVAPSALLDELSGPNPPRVLDVRTRAEWDAGHLEQASFLPVSELRDRLGEVPRDQRIVVHCKSGYRSYLAQRILMNAGISDVRNVLGGWLLIEQERKARAAANGQEYEPAERASCGAKSGC